LRYCGVVPCGQQLQLVMLEELREPEPPVRLDAVFFEPASAAQVARELRGLEEAVTGVAGPQVGGGGRRADQLLEELGVTSEPLHPELGRLFHELQDLGVYGAAGEAPDVSQGPVPEGAYRAAPVFETNVDGIFCALQSRRVPARRHPLGVQLRIEELAEDHVIDSGGNLWHRRIEEIDAAAVALCAHRYAVGHASWIGAPEEGVVVLPGASIPGRFSTRGVLPPVERLELPRI
jgi:hypothetical protein